MTQPQEQIYSSERFAAPPTRRDFLGMAAAWSAIVAFVMAILGAARLPMPSVFPESNSRVKLGRPARYNLGSATYFPKSRLWLYRSDEGFYAISSVCTHLGCIAERSEEGDFSCPCHGSKFDAVGNLTGGPAPKGLVWVGLSLSPEGWLIADTLEAVDQGTVFDA